MTLQGALRYDRASSFFPAADNGSPGNKWTNFQPITFPETQGVTGYNDISYRGGITWDVFGNGKTSLKVFGGKYLQNADNQANYIANAPSLDGANGRPGPNFQTRATRTYIDFNGNHVPDCPGFATINAPNGECIGADLGNFGQLGGLTATDPNVLKGWGVRPYDTQFNVSIQQRDPAAHVGGIRLLPPVVLQLLRDRQRQHGSERLPDVLVHRAHRPEARQPERPDGELRHSQGQRNINNVKNVYTSVGAITGNDSDWSNHWHGFDFTLTARASQGLSAQLRHEHRPLD